MKLNIDWKQHLKTIAVFLLVVAIGGALVVVSGVAPIAASSGHWEITRWFLNFSKKQAVATHSMTIEVPNLDKQKLILQGAGHYEIGCRQCHGIPGRAASSVVSMMTPKPPDLSIVIPRRDPEELFYIVKHGIMLTGMPAWPDQKRDDEVWSVVAFLLKYPQLTPGEYKELALGALDKQSARIANTSEGGSLAIPHTVIETCAGCHGIDGQGREGGVFPKLAGQKKTYLQETLKAYQSFDRHSGTMAVVASQLDEQTIAAVSSYYSALEAAVEMTGEISEADKESLARGKQIATEGIPAQNVPSCADCHPIEGIALQNGYPILNRQPADYLEQQLQLFKKRKRGGTERANLMHTVADHLKPEQMREVSLFYESGAGKE